MRTGVGGRARRTALVALAASVALALPGAALLGLPAAAQDTAQDTGTERFVIREVDATDPGAVRVTFAYGGDRSDAARVAVRHNGREVERTGPVTTLGEHKPLGVVLAVDLSGAMQEGGAIERAREASLAFLDGLAPGDAVAVVGFDGQVRELQGMTTDRALASAAIRRLGIGGGRALHDAVVRAVAILERAEARQPNIVLITAGADTSSVAGLGRAGGALTRSGTMLQAALVATGAGGQDPVRRLASLSGGQVVVTDDPTTLEPTLRTFAEALSDQYVVTFAAPDLDPARGNEVTLTIGDQTAGAEITPGGVRLGAGAVAPTPVAQAPGPRFLQDNVWLGLALLAVAAGAATWALITIFATREKSLEDTLAPYEEGFVPADDGDDRGGTGGFTQTAVLQRAVEATGRLAERRGIMPTVEAKLERANLPLRPAEALFFYIAFSVLALVLTAAVAGSLIAVLIVGALAVLLPPAVLNLLANRRRKTFQSQLPDTLQLLAGTLKAGYSLMQGVEAVSREVSEPMGRELRRVVTESRLGRPLEESLEAVAERMDSLDFAWAVMAIRIQREVGGNLSELLTTVADTMTERERLRRDVNALTAEGRVSAIVLGILPVGIGLFIMGANPGYLDPLFDRTVGQIMLGGALVLMLAGFLWMRKIIDIEI